jgi:hypothetical protein
MRVQKLFCSSSCFKCTFINSFIHFRLQLLERF